jgi:hypothetical protein
MCGTTETVKITFECGGPPLCVSFSIDSESRPTSTEFATGNNRLVQKMCLLLGNQGIIYKHHTTLGQPSTKQATCGIIIA